MSGSTFRKQWVFSVLIFLIALNYLAMGHIFETSVHDRRVCPVQKLETTTSNSQHEMIKEDVCITSVCNQTAYNILSKMKLDVDPCNNFYEFVCGEFMEKENIPNDSTVLSQFTIITDKVQNQLKDIITQERPSTDPEHLLLPNKYYKACMNASLIEQLGSEPVETIIESLGGWPLLKGESWDSSNTWTWQEAIKDFRRLRFGVNYIISFGIVSDPNDSNKRIVNIDEGFTGLSSEYLKEGLNDTIVSAYYEYMVDMAVLFGANRSLAEIQMMDSLKFEMELSQISLTPEERLDHNALNNKRTLKQMQETYPFVNWVEYINSLFLETTVDENEKIIVTSLKYMNNIEKVLANTPKLTIANYMMWRIFSSTVLFMPQKFRDRQFQFNKYTTGIQEPEARWKECVDIVNNAFDLSIGSLYAQTYFPNENKVIAKEMVDNIRSTFDEMLTEADWMDSETKDHAKQKLKAMKELIGYPDELLDNKLLAEYYSGLSIDSDQYFESNLNLLHFFDAEYYARLRKPVDKNDWKALSIPTEVNAFYHISNNNIQFPAAILQGHFFNAQLSKYMNFGAIGHIIGHEVTHCVDNQGSQYDLNGNLFDWWEKNTKNAYIKKAQCFIDQFGGYTDHYTGLKINGVITQGENIADSGGVTASYRAYRKWAKQNGPEPKLPGLKYTPDQMFWISAGQTLCAKMTLEILKDVIKSNPHTPAEQRVNGMMVNRKEFAQDFQCAEGTPMNPFKKCEMW